jgi:hypothetical protein
MKKPKNLEFEPVHPKNVLLASVVHGISCLLQTATSNENVATSFIKDYKNISWIMHGSDLRRIGKFAPFFTLYTISLENNGQKIQEGTKIGCKIILLNPII